MYSLQRFSYLHTAPPPLAVSDSADSDHFQTIMASESAPRFCLELLPPDEEQTLPASNLVPSPLGSGPLGLALDKNVFWRNDRTLHVRFLAGSPLAQRQVKQYAQEWENYANIKFVFDQS